MLDYQNEKLYEDEIAFNIFELLKLLLKDAKIIMIGVIIGAIVMPSVLYMKELNNYNAQMSVINNQEDIVLSESDELGVERYFLLKSRVEYLKEKVNRTDVHHLDLGNVYQTNIVYNIDAEETYRFDIANTIIRYLDSESFLEQCDLVFAKFLGDKNNTTQGVFVVSVYAGSEDECEEKTEMVKLLIQEYDSTLQEAMPLHTLNIVTKESMYGFADTLYDNNKKYLDEYRTVKSEFDSCKAELNEVQQNAIMQIEAQDEEQIEDATYVKPRVQIVYIVLGAVLGAIVVCLVLVCIYLLGGKLQTEREIYRRIGYIHFGTIKGSSNEQINHILSSIEIANSLNEKNITVLSTVELKENEQIKSLCKQLEDKDVHVKLVENATKDMDILSKIKEANAVVFVECIMKTKIKNMYRIAHFCEQVNANVLGYVMIDK